MKYVFVFIEKGTRPVAGHFEEYAAFAESELEARLNIETKYKLYGRELLLDRQFEDRRKPTNRRGS